MPMLSRRLRCEPLEDRTAPAAGDLDPTFGEGGLAQVPFDVGGGRSYAADVAVLPSGEMFVVGTAGNPSAGNPDAFAVAKLTWSGALDPAFGTGGQVLVPVGSGFATAVAVQPDGKIVVAGGALVPSGSQSFAQIAVVRLNPDGRLDPTFGAGGKVYVAVGAGPATAVALQPDGKIVVAGEKFVAPDGSNVTNSDFAVARLNPDGSLDTSFDSDGWLTIPFDLGTYAKRDEPSAVVVQPDGQIVVAGSAEVRGSQTYRLQSFGRNFAAARLNPDGSLDPSFGETGKVNFSLGGSDNAAADAVLQPDGRIVLVGYSGAWSTLQGSIAARGAFAVARLNPDGSLDGSFGAEGKAILPTDPADLGQRVDMARAVFVQPNGKIVVGGMKVPLGDVFVDNPLVARLNPDGSLDGSFGAGGMVTLPADASVAGIALQHPGKIILAATLTPRGGASTTVTIRLVGEPIGPGAVQAGGRPDGSAVVLSPTDGRYGVADAFQFFPGFPGTVRTATADVTGDGVADFIGGAGPGGGPQVVVFDGKTGAEVVSTFAFEATFTGGVFVAAADLNGDGRVEVVVTPDEGGGPVVAVYDGAALTSGAAGQLARFFGIDDPDFRGGARPALGDLNGDGSADLIVSAGFLGGPRVAVFDGKSVAGGGRPVKLLPDFFAFEDTLRNGAFVAAGDVSGDGTADIAFGGGPGGAPRVRLFDGKALLAAGSFANLDTVPAAQRANFFAGDSSLRGGVRLAIKDADGDGTADLVTGSGEGEPSRVRVYRSASMLANPTPVADQEFDPFGAVLADGVFVG